MAKQVSNVFIRLGIENFEGIEKLKSAFRELDRSIGPTSRSIDAAVAAVKNYADASTRSEQLIRGQIEAFKGLRSQVDVSGRQYSELTTEINQLQAELRGSTDAVDRQRQALLSSFNQNERNVRTIREHVNALTQLQTQTRANSSAFIALGADVELAAERLANAERVLSTLRSVLTRGLPATGAGAQRRITELDEGIRAQQAIIDEIDLRVPAERNLASVIKERAEAEEKLNRALVDRRQLAFQERARAGRQDVRIAAEAFSNPPVGGTGFLSIENIGRRIGNVPNTIAGINQELGEMRERLSNVALEGRDFIEVLDYIDTLNRRLRSATTEFQTPRQQALADVQARLDAQRQTLAQSGFGAFSASISGRSFRAEARSKTDAAINTASTAMEEAYTARIEAARAGIRRNTELEVQQLRLLDEEDEKNHQATMQRMADEAAAGTRWFNEQMALSDRLTRRSSVLKNTLGFGGRDLSSFYQGVIDIGTARQRSTQQLMGRTPEQAIGDIYRMSTISQTRIGEGSLDAEQALRQRAIAYSGNSRAVQQAFATYAAGQTPGALYPKTGESSTAYIRRVETSMEQGLTTTLTRFRNFVDVFGEKLRGAGDGYLQSERDLRRAAIRFSGNAPAVIEAFRRAPLGTTSTALLPKGNESREDYVARLGVGATAENFRLPTIPQFSKNTVRELQDIRQRLQDVRLDLDPLAVNFEATERRITKSVQRIDRELSKRETGGRRGLGGRQLTQIAGAALSGGIFGGPEGFLGGVIGGAVGGVGGSFAGAAFGAQAGMFRQQLAGTADYAAQIGKLQIALRGVSGSQANYNQAISAAASATRDLNIPQQEATAGITRLSAAVLGAGGQMSDATFAFRAISESIKATGGNAEQVDGALLALTQVFSKGKVSAEELNQIAERLPGTFTLFAKATGKTGPELQKALQQGTVGLNDLMKFLELASTKHGQTALKIAASNEEAGTRMSNAFKAMSLEVGKALLPIGAELQTSFAKFATDMIPALTATAKGVGGLLKTIVDNGAAIAAIAKLAVQFGIATYALKAFTALQGPMTVALQAIALQFGTLNAQTIAAETRLKAFAATARAAAASLVKPIVLTAVIIGADIVIRQLNNIEAARKQIAKQYRELSPSAWFESIGGNAQTRDELERIRRRQLIPAANAAREDIAALQRRIQEQREMPGMFNRGPLGMSDSAFAVAFAQMQAGTYKPKGWGVGDITSITSMTELAVTLKAAENNLNTIVARYNKLTQELSGAPTDRTRRGFPNPTAAGQTEAEKTAKQRAETERRLAQEGIKIEMDGQLKAHEYAIELDRRRYELRKQLSDEASAHEIANLQGGARTIAQAYAAYRSRIAEIDRGLVEAAQNTGLERKRLQASQAVENVTAGTGMQGRYRQGSIGPTSTGPHFDIKQVGGGRFSRTDLDQYVQVNGRPLSSGLTVPGGTFDAPRAGRPRHGGIDYAFGAGAALELKGGAQWVKLSAGTANGDVATLKFPDGRMFTVLHGKFERTAAATASTAQGRSQLLREQKTAGKTDYSALGVSRAEGLQQVEALVAEQHKTNAFRTLVDTYTESIRSQNYELSTSNALNVERNRLLAAGASSTYIDYAMRLVEVRRTEADMLNRINIEEKDPEKRAQQVRNLNALYAETRDLLRQNYELSTAFDNSLGLREGAQRYVESIGTMREATASLTQQGFKGLEDVIVQLTTTGTANFQAFAASILEQTARMIIQQLVLKSIMQALGMINPTSAAGASPVGAAAIGYGGGFTPPPNAKGNVFTANGIVPYAMGGIVTRPTLFPFANGGAIGTGLMGEAGPEAIIPLSRGANGKLGIAGGGGTTNVVVNVDASGNAQVQGREDTANQLGRVISQAVQAELIKQKRPGGLLA